MVEEKKEHPDRNQKQYRIIKLMTLSLLFVLIFVFAGTVTVESTSSSGFCKSCHEMKPEYNTWKVSSHSEVECSNCHIGSSIKDYAKAKANGLVQVYKKTTNTFTAPIQMPKDIPDSACEKCHDMKARKVTASGDLIIPHDKHLNKDIKCVQCHSGIAHGNIAKRNVTFKSDYDKWDDSLAKSMMSVKFTKPKMEECVDCHKARNVSTECKTCHESNMFPKSHEIATFKTQDHGKLADKDIQKCNSCHLYMTENEIHDTQNAPASQQFLSSGSVQQRSISAQEYAKENTFCQKCHASRPQSHDKNFANIHGAAAKEDQEKCFACHSEQKITVGSTITSTGLVSNAVQTSSEGSAPACASCHPASHEGKNYKQSHPISLEGVTQPTAKCYSCHNKPKCTSCHKEE